MRSAATKPTGKKRLEAGRNGRISVRVEKTRAGLGGDRWHEDDEDDGEDDKNKFHYSEATSTMIYLYASYQDR